jgi:hypothetical protein
LSTLKSAAGAGSVKAARERAREPVDTMLIENQSGFAVLLIGNAVARLRVNLLEVFSQRNATRESHCSAEINAF